LWLAAPERAPATILMSSSVPGEGKTTAAVSIAVCAAQLGRRVLLIDFDFKRPAVSRELGDSSERGIFDLILRNRTADDVIKHIPDLGLDYLPMSCCPVDVLPLLAGDQIPNVLRQLQEKYDCVIIDGPPLLGIAESRLLAPMVDKVVLVVKWGSTRCDVAQHAIDLLRSCGGLDKHVDAPIVLMTQVDLKKHAAYRYGDAGESLAKYKYYYSRSVRT
jgi:Mrp family chromosome partitioning ATPase